MKIKLGEVLSLYKTIELIINDTDLNDHLFKFKLLGIMNSLKESVQNFEIIRNQKVVQYGVETDEGGITPKEYKEAIENFNKDMSESINSEVTINIVKLSAIEVFNKGIKVEHLMGLYPIIKE